MRYINKFHAETQRRKENIHLALAFAVIAFVTATLLWVGCSKPTKDDEVDLGPHPQGWLDEGHPKFHGSAVVADSFNTVANCGGCHLTTTAADTNWSCWECHNYYPHLHTNQGIEGFKHGGVIRANSYQVWLCKNCHGQNYTGGAAGVNCTICHAQTPEACNTCHGNFHGSSAEAANWAPPTNLLGQSDSTITSVGVHRWHVKPQSIPGQQWIGGPYGCIECHTIPSGVGPGIHPDVPNHPAAVPFGPIAKEEGANPVWNRDQATCTNTYCHQPPEFGNPINTPPKWNLPDNSQVACGTCHLMPPPTEELHEGMTTCGCHLDVWGPGNVILNQTLHVNGEVEVY